MPYLQYIRQFTHQPRGATRFHGRYGPITALVNPGIGPIEEESAISLLQNGTAVLSSGLSGAALETTAADGSYWESGVGYWPTNATEFTLEVLVSITSVASLCHIFGLHDVIPTTDATNGTRRSFLAFGGAGDQIYFWGDGADLASGVSWRVDGSLQHVFCTALNGTMRFYRDGVEIANGSTPSLVGGTNNYLYVGHRHGAGSVSPALKLFKASYRNCALSAGQIYSLTNNPWEDFEAEPACNVYFFPSAAGTSKGPLLGRSRLLTSGPLISGRLVA